MKKTIIAVLALVGLVVYGAYDYLKKSPSEVAQIAESQTEQLETGIQKGQLAPDFILADMNGEPIQLTDYKGKKVLLNFWATWCPPCRVEMPHMQKFYEDYQAEDVIVIGINLTPTEKNLDTVQSFVNDEQLTFPIVLDEDGDVKQTYNIVAYPTSYLLDSRGVIQEIFKGAISYEIMEKYVSQMN